MAANIPLIGESASEAIANELLTFEGLTAEVETGYKNIAKLNDFGPKMIANLKKYGATRFGMLWEAGVRVTVETKAPVKTSKNALTFVITGSFEIPRKEIEIMIKDAGHKKAGSVSKKTSYLLASPGEEGTVKYNTARDLGIKIINSLDELKEVIGNE